jgi:hypothetical protein
MRPWIEALLMPARAGGVFHHRIGLQQVGIAGIEPAAFEQALHPRGDPCQHDADLLVRRRRQGSELKRAIRVASEEDALEEQGVEVEVQIQSAAEALDDGHASRPAVKDPASARTMALKAQQHPHIHTEHGARQRVIPRQEKAKPVRQTQHPLAHGHPRQYMVDEARGGLGHAPAATARAEAPALARERHEPLERTLGAAQAREAVGQHPAGQEVSELLLHEFGQWGAIRMTPGRLEEGVEVLLDHAVQHGVLGVAWPVVAGAEGHSGDIDSARERRQCPEMDTPQPWGTPGGGPLSACPCAQGLRA